MSALDRIYPSSIKNILAFNDMLNRPDPDRPIIEMNDDTARNREIIRASIIALKSTWRGGQEAHIPDEFMDRRSYWGAYAREHAAISLPVFEEFLNSETGDGSGKTALDLGAGNSAETKALLAKGWHVIAVDYSERALDPLISACSEQIRKKQLETVCEDLNTFASSVLFDLVLAIDVLSYIDPEKFEQTWQKIHSFVKPGGIFIGTLYRSLADTHDPRVLRMQNHTREQGAWFLPDRRMVRPLLTHVGYEIQTCRYFFGRGREEAWTIQFRAQKRINEKEK